MAVRTISAWLSSWFDPEDPDLLSLRHGQLMHVMTTGHSALVSSLATIAAVAGYDSADNYVADFAGNWSADNGKIGFGPDGTNRASVTLQGLSQGNVNVTVVPWPAALVISTKPPSCIARSRIPNRPSDVVPLC